MMNVANECLQNGNKLRHWITRALRTLNIKRKRKICPHLLSFLEGVKAPGSLTYEWFQLWQQVF
jgi:hypothetical protein